LSGLTLISHDSVKRSDSGTRGVIVRKSTKERPFGMEARIDGLTSRNDEIGHDKWGLGRVEGAVDLIKRFLDLDVGCEGMC